MNESGLCNCGCNSKTKNAPRTDRCKGWIKGYPMNYLKGHQCRNKFGQNSSRWKGGIWRSVDKGKMVYLGPHLRVQKESILLAQKVLGTRLPPKTIVHHHKGKHDNSILIICQNQAYHLFLHQRIRAFRVCGNAKWRKCQYCKHYDKPENLIIYPQKKSTSAYHRDCRNKYKMEQRKIRCFGYLSL